MTIPSLPTDNLYKFVALSGLVLIITSLALPMLNNDKGYKLFTQLNSNKTQIEIEIKELTTQDSIIDALLNQLEAGIDSDSLYPQKDINIYSLKYRDDVIESCYGKEFRDYYEFIEKHKYTLFPREAKIREIKNKMKERDEIRLEIKKLHYQFINKNAELKTVVNIYERREFILLVSSLIGIILTSFGFYYWYYRVQKYLDKKLKKETEEL